MSKEEILVKLKEAITDLDDDEVSRLIREGIEAGLPPMDLITKGLSAGLTAIGEGFENGTMFMSDLVLSGEIMNDALEMLRPEIEAGGEQVSDVMVIGTVEGDQHSIGKRIVSAIFAGAGYNVIDIGEDQAASAFVDATKEHKPTVVGASAILGAAKAECKVINKALIDAGVRDDVIFIVGGWEMTQAWSDNVGADCYGENALEALRKVQAIKSGELRKFNERAKS